MDKAATDQMIEGEIQKMIDAFMPNGGGATMTEVRLRTALEHMAKKSFALGQSYALLNLKTCDDLASEFGVSLRRMQAIAKERHERFGVGFQARGNNPWLFSADEIESLRPGKPGKRKKFVKEDDENAL